MAEVSLQAESARANPAPLSLHSAARLDALARNAERDTEPFLDASRAQRAALQ